MGFYLLLQNGAKLLLQATGRLLLQSSPKVARKGGEWLYPARTGDWLHDSPRQGTWAVESRGGDWIYPDVGA